MKYVITEQQLNNMTNIIQEYANTLEYDGVCRIEIWNDELPKGISGDIYVVFDKKWLSRYSDQSDIIHFTTKTKREIQEDLETFFSLTFNIYSYSDNC